ncbi:hypothetical protein MTR67_019742 [Solanum verrucosum]|uniref:Reverse transcriptase zinc-binding domain-containing protein n=1 Tax=Solanum verrucosum TaxID=315347 RepID=A0AAF0QPA5_SOLVR|nr:hypothetical protein MTR67_019742 [Solanum verrucosum]
MQTGKDVLWWKGNSRGEFKVNSTYKLMDQTNPQTYCWPWKQIWRSRIPHKISCFIWLLAKEAAPTQDNLKKRGITLCSSCFLCGEALETGNHLYTLQLWMIFLNLKSISWTMPRKVSEALKSWEAAWVNAKDRNKWRIIPASI